MAFYDVTGSTDQEYVDTTKEVTQEVKEESQGFWGDVKTGFTDVPKQVLGGFGDAANETSEALDDLWDYGAKHVPFMEEHEGEDFGQLPTVPEAKSVTGDLIRKGSQFMTAFIPYAGAMRYAGVTNTLARGMMAGGLAEGTAFDPHNERLSDLVDTLAQETDVPILEYLSDNNPLVTDPNDSDLEGRFKNALEGTFIDLGFEGLGKGLYKAFRTVKKTHTPEAAEAAKKKVDQMSPEEIKLEQDLIKKRQIDPSKFKVYTPEKGAEELVRGLEANDFDLIKDVTDFAAGMKNDGDLSQFHESIAKAVDKKKTYPDIDAEKAADEMGLDWKELKRVKGETEDLHLVVRKATAVDKFYQDTLRTLGQKEDRTDADVLAFKQLSLLFNDHRMTTKGIKTDIGRALRATQANQKIHSGFDIEDVQRQIVETQGDSQQIKKLMDRVGTTKNGKVIGKALEDTQKKDWGKFAEEYWINAQLSSLGTQARNFAGNMVAPFFKSLELGIAAGKHGNETSMKDAVAFMRGNIEGAFEALNLPLFKAASETEYGGNVYKTFMEMQSQIDPGRTHFDTAMNVPSGTPAGKMAKYVGKPLGQAMRMPSRVMLTMDEFFKTASYRGDLRMQASFKFRGLSPDERADEIAKFLADPPPDAMRQATEEMRKSTYQNDAADGIKNLVNKTEINIPGTNSTVRPLKYILPFVRTPTNLLKFVGHRTPIVQKMSKQMKADIEAGGIRKELAEAKIYSGTMMYGIGIAMAASGHLTGSVDEDRHKAGRLAGAGKYKWKDGQGNYHSYSTADPIGTFFALSTDTVELMEEAEDEEIESYISSSIMMVTSMISEKSYLQGLSRALTAISGTGLGADEGRFEWWRNDFGASFIPNFVRQGTRNIDPIMRENRTLLDSIVADVPGASKTRMPKRDPITGEPLQYNDSGLLGWKPFYESKASKNPVHQELYRMERPVKGPNRSIRGVELDDKEYDEYVRFITKETTDGKGRNLEEKLKYVIASEKYKSLPDKSTKQDARMTKEKILMGVFSDYRRAGTARYIKKNKELYKKIMRLRRGEK